MIRLMVGGVAMVWMVGILRASTAVSWPVLVIPKEPVICIDAGDKGPVFCLQRETFLDALAVSTIGTCCRWDVPRTFLERR